MINKRNLWFITISSIILVVSIYYIAIPQESISLVSSYLNNDEVTLVDDDINSEITSLRVMKEEENTSAISELQDILLDDKVTVNDKSEAYNKIKNINKESSLSEKMEELINKEFNLSSFVNLNNGNAQVTIINKDEDKILANKIINTINSNLNNTYYVTVKFQ